MPERRDGGIGLPMALLLVGALVAATLVIGTVAALLGVVARGTTLGDALLAVRSDPLLVSLAQLGGAGVAIGVGVMVAHEDTPLSEALGIRPIHTAIGVLALTAGLAGAFPLREIAILLADLVPAIAPDPRDALVLARQLRVESVADALIVPLAFVAVPALAEELFFRGLLLPGLARRMDPRIALVLSAGLFGIIHVSPIAIVYATLAGLALGWVRLKTGSVVACVAMHGAFNAMPVLLPPELFRLRGFNTIEPDVYHLPLALVLGSALVTLACLAAIAHLADAEEDDE